MKTFYATTTLSLLISTIAYAPPSGEAQQLATLIQSAESDQFRTLLTSKPAEGTASRVQTIPANELQELLRIAQTKKATHEQYVQYWKGLPRSVRIVRAIVHPSSRHSYFQAQTQIEGVAQIIDTLTPYVAQADHYDAQMEQKEREVLDLQRRLAERQRDIAQRQGGDATALRDQITRAGALVAAATDEELPAAVQRFKGSAAATQDTLTAEKEALTQSLAVASSARNFANTLLKRAHQAATEERMRLQAELGTAHAEAQTRLSALQSAGAQLTAARAKRDQSESDLQVLRTKEGQLERDRTVALELRDAAQFALERSNTAFRNLDARLAAEEKALAAARTYAETLHAKSTAQISALEQEQATLVQRHKEAITRLQKEKGSATAGLEQQMAHLRTEHTGALQAVNARITAAQSERDAAQTEITEVSTRMRDEKEKALAALRTELTREAATRCASLEATIKRLEGEGTSFAQQIEQLKQSSAASSAQQLEEMQEAHQATQAELRRKEAKLAEAHENIATVQAASQLTMGQLIAAQSESNELQHQLQKSQQDLQIRVAECEKLSAKLKAAQAPASSSSLSSSNAAVEKLQKQVHDKEDLIKQLHASITSLEIKAKLQFNRIKTLELMLDLEE